MRNKNLIISYSISFIIFFLYSYSFFRIITISIIISGFLSIKFKGLFLDFINKKELVKKREMLKNFLDILNASVISGRNFYQSLCDCKKDLEAFFGSKELIKKEVNTLILNIDNGFKMDDALDIFKNNLDFDEASIFVDSLKIGLKSGMDIKEIVANSKLAINEQILVENEISMSLNNSRREFIIMIVLPIIILLLLSKTNMRALNIIDYIVRSFVFLMVIFAIYLGEKIVRLEI